MLNSRNLHDDTRQRFGTQNILLKLITMRNSNTIVTSVVYSGFALKLEDHIFPRIFEADIFLLTRGLDQRASECSCATQVI